MRAHLSSQPSASRDPALRQEAQRRLRSADSAPEVPLDESDPLRLIHELQVHQIELEMQNEVLRETLAQTQLLRVKYQDLYDMAPVGYFTLSAGGDILECNRLGARLLGLESGRLPGQPLRAFFSDESLAPLEQVLLQARQGAEVGVAQHLRLRKKQPMPLYVNAQAHALVEPSGHTTVRLVLMDVSALKMATDDVVQALLEKIDKAP